MSEPASAPQRPTLEPFEGDFARILCVVAHPDDIEYGAAAAVHRWVGEGVTVRYFLLTRGEAGIDTMRPCGESSTPAATSVLVWVPPG